MIAREGDAEELMSIKKDISTLLDGLVKKRSRLTNMVNMYEQIITAFTNKKWSRNNKSVKQAATLIDPTFEAKQLS